MDREFPQREDGDGQDVAIPQQQDQYSSSSTSSTSSEPPAPPPSPNASSSSSPNSNDEKAVSEQDHEAALPTNPSRPHRVLRNVLPRNYIAPYHLPRRPSPTANYDWKFCDSLLRNWRSWSTVTPPLPLHLRRRGKHVWPHTYAPQPPAQDTSSPNAQRSGHGSSSTPSASGPASSNASVPPPPPSNTHVPHLVPSAAATPSLSVAPRPIQRSVPNQLPEQRRVVLEKPIRPIPPNPNDRPQPIEANVLNAMAPEQRQQALEENHRQNQLWDAANQRFREEDEQYIIDYLDWKSNKRNS